MNRTLLLLVPLLVALLAGPAWGAAVFYSDGSSWLAAAGGSTTFSEDFSGFTTDTEFRTGPVALDGMTIQQVGNDFFQNYVDSPQFGYDAPGGEFNGTNYAALFTNLPEGNPEIEVQITFDAPNQAFGFTHWLGQIQEGAQLEIYDGVTLIDSQSLGSVQTGEFFGYVLDGGDQATSVIFSSIDFSNEFSDVGEGFNIDDLQGVAVPEPGSLALLAAGLAGLAARRQERGAGDRR